MRLDVERWNRFLSVGEGDRGSRDGCGTGRGTKGFERRGPRRVGRTKLRTKRALQRTVSKGRDPRVPFPFDRVWILPSRASEARLRTKDGAD